MKLHALLAALNARPVNGRGDVEVRGITYDSRMVRPGYLFVAVPGARDDGHLYIAEAVDKGAVAVVVQREFHSAGRIPAIRVPDSRYALAMLSNRFFGEPSRKLNVIGVTGTNGKTTVCTLIRHILRAAGKRTALFGTIEYSIGSRVVPADRTTPEAPLVQSMLSDAVRHGSEYAIMEVSSHGVAQKRVSCIEFASAVFTNLSREHCAFHGSQEKYFNAKARLFTMPNLKQAVINIDDKWGARLTGIAIAPVMSYGFRKNAQVRISAVQKTDTGSAFQLDTENNTVKIRLPLMGTHNIYNACAAATVCMSEGIALECVRSALETAEPARGRLEEIKNEEQFRVFVDYAHTEDALECVLRTLRERCHGRVICVFGCGGDRDRDKRAPMGRVASRLADISIVTTDNPRSEEPARIMNDIVKGFRGAKNDYCIVEDRAEAIAIALSTAQPGDIVLVAGKGHEQTQEFSRTVVPFSDHQIIRGFLEAMAYSRALRRIEKRA